MEQTRQKNKATFNHSLGVIIGLLTIIALFFTLYSVQGKGYFYRDQEWTDNGFNFLKFNSEWLGLGDDYVFALIIIGLVSWAMLIVGTLTVILSIKSILKDGCKKSHIKLIITCIVLIFLYMLSGIIITIVSSGFGVVINATTYAYIPFILVLPFFILYMSTRIKKIRSNDNVTLETRGCYIDIVKHILFCTFTFGIWQLIWIHKTTKYLNRAKSVPQNNPTTQLLLCLFVPFYSIYWFFEQGKKLEELKNGIGGYTPNATTYLIMSIFASSAAYLFMQVDINYINQKANETKE